MKHVSVTLFSTLVLISISHATESGVMVYKERAWHTDDQSKVVAIKSAEQYHSNTEVITSDGRKLTILPGQNPLIIFQGSDIESRQTALRTLKGLAQKSPGMRSKLTKFIESWTESLADLSEDSAALPNTWTQQSGGNKPIGVADELHCTDGTSFQDVIFLSVSGMDLHIRHSTGAAVLQLEQLPQASNAAPQMQELIQRIRAELEQNIKANKEKSELALKQKREAEAEKQRIELKAKQDRERKQLIEMLLKVVITGVLLLFGIFIIFKISSSISSNAGTVNGIRVLPLFLIAILLGFFHLVFHDGFPGVTLVPKSGFGYTLSITNADEVIRLWNTRRVSDALKGDPVLDHLVRELERQGILRRDEESAQSFKRRMERETSSFSY